MSNNPKTLFEKVWEQHVVVEPKGEPTLLYIDLQLVHEVTSPQAFEGLRLAGRNVRRADRTIATVDHNVPTTIEGRLNIVDQIAATQIATLRKNCAEFGIELYDVNSREQGIVHVIGPELGITKPGMTIVCGDSHTSTHGAFGALAFGIGTSEVEHVLATQTLPQSKPKTMAVTVDGDLPAGVTAKDIVLAIIGRLGTGGGIGHVIEYRGSAIRGLSIEGRMTVCNMSIEAGAKAGMVAPDDTTFSYLEGKPRAPQGVQWDEAVARWQSFAGDPDAPFDTAVDIDASLLEPMITYGTNPGMVLRIGGAIPDRPGDEAFDKALKYMGFHGGEAMLGKPVNVVFIGSCTNGRLEDLAKAAQILKGRKVAPGVRLLIVPGSQEVKRAAEAAGYADTFRAAGADWRESGCSMCLGMNGDTVAAGEYSVSTSNRNFEGRQGVGARTLLASPYTAAASAVRGLITDPRELL